MVNIFISGVVERKSVLWVICELMLIVIVFVMLNERIVYLWVRYWFVV